MKTHPNESRLRDFALGIASPHDSSIIGSHLEECPSCCGRIEELDDDPFVSRLRTACAHPEVVNTLQLSVRSGDTRPDVSERGADFTKLGGYRILRELGHGGMGIVYEARDDQLGRPVALKVMRPEIAARSDTSERFLREARAAARLESDYVVPIWHVGADSGTPFIVMPLLAGESLAERLAREPISPPELTMLVGRQVAEGLAAAHACGLVHRDVKPANIWLEGDPNAADLTSQVRRVRLLDFGLAWPTDELHLTTPGSLLGTPGFMSPEQARGEELGPRSDLFSLGAVLYRMATGRLPFDGTTVTAVLTALALDTPAAPTNGSAALSSIIMRMLAKDKESRPASAGEVADALAPNAVSVAPRRRGWRMAIALALIGVAVAAGAIVIEIRRPDGTKTTVEAPSGSNVKVDENGDVVVELPNRAAKTHDPSVDAERRAADWVLERGGAVMVRDDVGERWVCPPQIERAGALASLPAGALTVTVIDFSVPVPGTILDDVGLNSLTGLPHLRYADFRDTAITDASLKHLGDLPALVGLVLEGTSVTDAGLFHLRKLNGMQMLYLGRTRVTDAGLVHLQGMRRLQDLRLDQTAVTGGGLAALRELENLVWLALNNAPAVDDQGLAHLGRLGQLEDLNLHGTGVTDAGLAHLGGLKRLKSLNLSKTSVTDAGLEHLRGLTELRELHLYAAAIRGPGLEKLQDLPHLARLYLSRTEVDDGGLAHLTGLPTLSHLNLFHTRVTDEGVTSLEKMRRLSCLNLIGTRVSDEGAERLRHLPELRELYLQDTAVTAAALERLQGLLPDCDFGPPSR